MMTANLSPQTPWWRGAVIYQIYPRSFQDSNGDGIGDLPGITNRLEHIAALGVDAIWISPFYTSPMRDFGYDVADYCDVDPMFGTLADFDAMLARAHELGIKVLVDQIYAHTSSDHAWFAESRSSRDNPRSDWYVWVDANADGTPPNNWQSVFGGPSWTWDARRGQYYLHPFLTSQPQLNLHNPAVQDALLNVARFWLERGVDGFRLDALNFAMHDPQLRDNPPAPASGKVRSRPFDFQQQTYNQFHPDTVRFLERLRAVTDEFANQSGAIFTLAEVGGDEDNVEMKRFTAGDHRLNSAYGFDFLYAPALTPQFVADAMACWPGEPGADGLAEGWPAWAFENHDAPRAVSRWCAPQDIARFARLKMALLTCLRGNVCIYQGEELGLEQDHIPFELLQDPEAIANWPLTLSRDGARTPMPWKNERSGGFTSGQPWLPLSAANLARAVAVQDADPSSPLALTKQMLALRRAHPALRTGSFELLHADDAVLAFRRSEGDDVLTCVFNLSPDEVVLPVGRLDGEIVISVNDGTVVCLPGYGAVIVKTQ
ncbi:MAG: alpha-glucosidase family protein [Novosphingobium sp.]